jgi:hypothetical protein
MKLSQLLKCQTIQNVIWVRRDGFSEGNESALQDKENKNKCLGETKFNYLSLFGCVCIFISVRSLPGVLFSYFWQSETKDLLWSQNIINQTQLMGVKWTLHMAQLLPIGSNYSSRRQTPKKSRL